MKPSRLFRLTPLLFVVTCVDDRDETRDPMGPSLKVVAGDASTSTVCVAYNRELDESQTQVARIEQVRAQFSAVRQGDDDAALQVEGDTPLRRVAVLSTRVAVLGTAISDACQ